VASLVVVVGVVVWLRNEVHKHTVNPADARVQLLEQIPAWLLIDKFHSELGSPSFRLRRDNNRSVEYFEGPSGTYWVEVVFDRSTGEVHGWVVTSCNRAYTPTFAIPGLVSVQLWHTTFAPSARHPGYADYDMNPGGSLGDDQMIAYVPSSTDSDDFQSYAVGLTGVCSQYAGRVLSDALVASNPHPGTGWFGYRGPASRAPARLRRVLARTRIDAFGFADSTMSSKYLIDIGPEFGFPQDFRHIGILEGGG
jgi:hypothetical protein